MKLVSCHVENFGKLTDLSFRFEEDLSILFAENGWGKSTFAAFLKVMFYGFDGENRRNEDGNERLRYRPWSGGIYGGSVVFTSAGRTYRMMRTFGTRKKEDVFCLFDEETGLRSGDYTQEVGEALFGIDRDSFLRTVFWSQRDHETAATTAIQAKIGDLAAETDDLPAYDAAVKRLRREMDRIRPDRASGLIRKREERLAALTSEASRVPLLTQQLDACTHREQELAGTLERIRADKQQYALRAEPQTALPEKTSQTKSSNASRAEQITEPEPVSNASLTALTKQLQASKDRLEMLSRIRRSAQIRGHREREELLKTDKELKKEKRRASYLAGRRLKMLRITAAACLMIGAAAWALSRSGVQPAILTAAAVPAAAAGILILFFSRTLVFVPPNAPMIEQLESDRRRHTASLYALKGRLERTGEQIRDEKRMYAEIRARIAGERARVPAPEPVRTEASSLTAQDQALREEIARQLRGFDRREEACRSELQSVRAQSDELRSDLLRCREAEDRIPDLYSELASLRRRYDTCEMTLRFLEEARNSFTSRYMNPFMRSFGKYYSMLTGESAESIRTDADFSITVLDGGLPRDPALLSEGTRDLIILCRRMAMIDAMYPGEKPFLVLDDPFSNLDDERVKGGLRFLHSASSEYQILYLTCHQSRL